MLGPLSKPMASRWASPAAGASALLAFFLLATGLPVAHWVDHGVQGGRALAFVGRANPDANGSAGPLHQQPNPPASVVPSAGGPSCIALSERYAALYDGPAPPPGLLPALFGGCP